MKVLQVINNLGSGGAERLIEQFVPEMKMRGQCDVDVLLLTDEGNVFEQSLKDSGVGIWVVRMRKPRSLLNVLLVRSFLTRGEYDVVHAHLFPTLYWVSLASRFISQKRRPRFLFTEHSTFNRRRERRILQPVERFIYSIFDAVISVTEGVRTSLVQWLDDENSRFVTINNGVALDRFRDAEPYAKHQLSSSLVNNEKLVCMVGRFSPAKDQETVIRSLKHLPEHVHLVLVGEGPLMVDHESFVKQLGIDDRVHFLGFRNDVERVMKTCDVIVMSSHWEGFALAAIEGMACGKPVIASNVPGLSSVVGGFGLLFERGNYNQLAHMIEDLLDDERLYQEVSILCSRRAESFGLERMVDEYITLYEKVLGNNKGIS